MKQYRYNKSIVNISGEVDRERIKRASIKFIKKINKYKKIKAVKEKNRNGNTNTSRAV